LKGKDVMVDRAKSMPVVNLRSLPFALAGKHLKQGLPAARVLLTVVIVAVSIAIAVLTS
jgi:hypothetical protein